MQYIILKYYYNNNYYNNIPTKYHLMTANLESRQYHKGNLRILYGGFPIEWVAGKLERQFMMSISNHFVNQYPNKQIHVVAPNWESAVEITNYVQQYPVDLLVVCSLSDPIWFKPIADIMPIVEAGYTLSGLAVDFWAVACFENFKNYTIEELSPTDLKYLFLNYNRKPHKHRIQLVQEFERQNLINLGVVTLGDSQYNLNECIDEYNKYGATDVLGHVDIPNDVYSLGRLDIWQQSFINIVSETVEQVGLLFLSEKIYKPIIGMRPFIINGSVEIYHWLRTAGFDCFEDLFPVKDIVANPNKATNIIAATIAQYKNVNLANLYNSILPRLLHNRNRFFEYSKNQLNNVQGELLC